jgi:hypothetical protein
MRDAKGLVAIALLGLGMAVDAQAGVLSNLLRAVPLPKLELACYQPSDGDTPASAAAHADRVRRETAPESGRAPQVDPDRGRSEESVPASTPGDAGGDFAKSTRPHAPRWKALLPGALN